MLPARSEPSAIYALVDPRTAAVRYIGVTVRLRRRLWGHIDDSKKGAETHCARWIAQLLAAKLKPVMLVLEDGVARDREVFWITHYRSLGANLTNLTDGGDGATGYKHRPEHVAALVARNTGRSHSAATRAAIAASLRGQRPGPETRAKLSAAKKGKPKSEQTRRRMSAGSIGKPKSAEHRAALSKSRREWYAQNPDAKIAHERRLEAVALAGLLSGREIARRLGVSKSFIGKLLREAKDEIRQA